MSVRGRKKGRVKYLYTLFNSSFTMFIEFLVFACAVFSVFSMSPLYAINVLGPVWTAASRLASYRTLTIIGGLLSSIGVILVSLSDSMPHLAVCMMVISKLMLDFLHCSPIFSTCRSGWSGLHSSLQQE